MRVSRLMLVTLRDVPAEAEIISHQLLLRAGYIRRVSAGIYAYLPMMWRVITKITKIVREEMNASGALESLLPQLHPAELWQRSGRWEGYTAGEGIMFHLNDRQGKELGLGPTHEEVITSITNELITSYKQLPINIYQIQTKFRDEIRPRFGLMRSREFIMKDSYSFHSNEADLQSTYAEMDSTYKNIFLRCGLKTVAVDADSGSIGGAASQEFMVTAETGEDLILKSEDGKYAANQEKAVSIAKEAEILIAKEESLIETPDQKSISDLCEKNNFHPSQILKVLVFLAKLITGRHQPILISIRGDQELNKIKLNNVLNKHLENKVIDIIPITEQCLIAEGLHVLPFGSLGPHLNDSFLDGAKTWKKKFLRLADHTASSLDLFICGANKSNEHLAYINWSMLGGVPKTVDIRKAKPGDRCLHDPNQILVESRGIEVGHIFQLGRKYSQSLKASFTSPEGSEEPFWMGCYGIGISRLAQAAIEQNHDESGLIWPLNIAPYEVIIVIANIQNPTQKYLGEEIYKDLMKAGIEVLLDDRTERAGVKFKDADLIGIPWRVVVGRDAETGQIELVRRSNKKTQLLSKEPALKKLIEEIYAKKN